MSMRHIPAAFYVLDRNSGKEILVTAELRHEYRDSCRYVRLNKPAPADTPDVIAKAKEQGTARQEQKKRTASVKKAPAKKATKKKA